MWQNVGRQFHCLKGERSHFFSESQKKGREIDVMKSLFGSHGFRN
jgi:hypothetical protein